MMMELLIVVERLNKVVHTSKHKKRLISNSMYTFRLVNEMKPVLIFLLIHYFRRQFKNICFKIYELHIVTVQLTKYSTHIFIVSISIEISIYPKIAPIVRYHYRRCK